MDITDSTLARFWAKVNKAGDCWEWTARRNYGYGAFWINNRTYKAHRMSWIIHNGSIPSDQCVLHSCDNPPCVNPAHLFLGSVAENNADRDRKGRNNQPKGSASGRSKLTENQVIEIRYKYAAGGITQESLSLDYTVSASQIWRVLRRESWKHI